MGYFSKGLSEKLPLYLDTNVATIKAVVFVSVVMDVVAVVVL